METIKTAVVVVLLLLVLYGVYVVLNKPELAPVDTAWQQGTGEAPVVELGKPTDPQTLRPAGVGPEAGPPKPAPALSAPPLFDAPRTADAPVRNVNDDPHARRLQAPPAELTSPVAPATATVREAAPPVDLPPAKPASRTLIAAADEPAREPHVASPADTSAEPSRPSAYVTPKNLNVTDDAELPALRAFDSAWSSAVAQLQKQQWSEALLTLSFFYNAPDLSGEERQRLIDLLDPLAGRVIYSAEHTLEAPYEVQPGETLLNVADECRVPAALLQNINGLANPQSLAPGTKLKVLRGPFRAEVDLNGSELVLFCGKYYAGRFPISIGNDPPPRTGQYEVLAMQEGREYESRDGLRIPARAADNPYGNVWIDLGSDLAIHGSPDKIPAHGSLGCISLNSRDAADLFGILSAGSKVLVR